MNDYIKHFNPNHDPRNGQFAPLPAGSRQQKKIARKYKKYAVKAIKDLNKNENTRYNKAYRDSTQYFNNEIRKINQKYNTADQKYYDEVEELETKIDKMIIEKYNEYTIDEFKNNKHFQNAQLLVDKYGAFNISDLAVENDKLLKEYSKKYH